MYKLQNIKKYVYKTERLYHNIIVPSTEDGLAVNM